MLVAMNVEQKIETIKSSIRELLKQHKELLENFQLLLTIPGIGENSYFSSNIKAFINAR
jgi:hypothetical protein